MHRGIISVVQTPFDADGAVDFDSMGNLLEDAIDAGVRGFLAPVVASEVATLSETERKQIARFIATTVNGRVPFIVGASADDPATCRGFAQLAEQVQAIAYLVAVPAAMYGRTEAIVPFFESVASHTALPLLIQDLQWHGSGLTLTTIGALREALPTLVGLKIETVPAGPKYTSVREAMGDGFFIAGGWAVPQLIEALDRGVDAMIPESAMVRVYAAIVEHHAAGRRADATALFRELLPVLAFANQELCTSIAFFKRLLVAKGLFKHVVMRQGDFTWDPFNARAADELIDLYLTLESRVQRPETPQTH